MDRTPRLRGRTPVEMKAEKWRPPPLQGGSRAKCTSAQLRRFFDIQCGSIWNDLQDDLAAARGNLLDVGCGAQPMRTLLSSEIHYLGIDTTDAEANFGYSVPDTRYFTGDRWPVEDGWADTILCTETLEHVPDSLPFLREAFRCTKPGGKLLLTVPFAARWHFIPHDYWRFTPTALTKLLHDAGFGQIEIYARGNEYTVACYKMMALILPMLFPQVNSSWRKAVCRLVGVPFLPLLGVLAVIANLSLRGSGGNDCLGYTVRASRPGTGV
jgi:SAM-dependent methyltransferase